MERIVQIVIGMLLLSLFPLKLLFGELLFSRYCKRRPRFGMRLCVSVVLLIIWSVALYLPFQNAHWLLQNTLYYFLQFTISAALLAFLIDESVTDVIVCAVSGYMTEHIAAQVFELCFGFLKANIREGDVGRYLLFGSLQAVIFFATAAAVYFLFARNATGIGESKSLKRRMLFLSVATLGIILLLSSVRDYYAGESYALMAITRILSIFSCITLLYIRYDLLEKSQLESEMSELERVMEIERKQFEQSRENIELINIKCHDMRHKIDAWERQGIAVDPGELDEMKELIGIYDAAIKTGNDTLDVILSEHSLYCEKHGIRLSCIADGERLGFMSTGDICSLFGNAIENAIEAVSKLSNPEDRIISFQVREQKGLLLVAVDNYYTGLVSIENGLPKTSKGDSQNHGFGVRSIRRIAQKYGGEVRLSADEMFHLTVLIPIPAK